MKRLMTVLLAALAGTAAADARLGSADFDVSDLTSLSPIGMLYQTGYLTIADCSDGLYQLRVPDEEVKRDIAALVAGAWAGRDARRTMPRPIAPATFPSGRSASTSIRRPVS